MRGYIFIFACLSLVACALGNNLILGRRRPNDILIEERPIFKPRVPGLKQTVTVGATAPPGYVISFISVTSLIPRMVSIRPIQGFIGTPTITVLAVGSPSWSLTLNTVVFAAPDPNSTTSTLPPSTSTTPKPTTTTKTSTSTTTTSTTPKTTTSTTPKTTTSTTPKTTTSTTPKTTTSTTPKTTTSTTPKTTTSTTPKTTTSTTPKTTTSTTPKTTTSTTPKTTTSTTPDTTTSTTPETTTSTTPKPTTSTTPETTTSTETGTWPWTTEPATWGTEANRQNILRKGKLPIQMAN